MFIRTLDELEKLGRRAPLGNDAFRSTRFLTAADGMGFSYIENRVRKGTDAVIWLRADTDMHLVSMFCPPLVGDEQHDKDGALVPSGSVPPGPPE